MISNQTRIITGEVLLSKEVPVVVILVVVFHMLIDIVSLLDTDSVDIRSVVYVIVILY
jgi:hypothetical protein